MVPLALFSSVVPGRTALPTPDPDDGAIDLPPGFRALVVADNLTTGRPHDPLRFLTVAPNGDIYVKSTANGMFVAFHGSWNRAPLPQAGYRVEFIPFDAHGRPTDAYEDFATGFPGVENLANPNDAHYRPSGVAVGPDGSLYVCETQKGRVWRIIYTGDLTPKAGLRATVAAPAQNFPAIGADTPGGKIYVQVCAACHMPNGSGVPGMQPALTGSKVADDAARLIDVLLQGPAAVLPANREKSQNAMPPFGAAYNDTDLASVINYIRKNFASGTSEVTPAQVAVERAKQAGLGRHCRSGFTPDMPENPSGINPDLPSNRIIIIWLIDRHNGTMTLLTTDHKMRPDHTHPTFSPDGKRILFQSGLLSDGKNLTLMTVTIPEYLQNPR